ncbi:hypothetical protein GCM10010924_12110 [Rhizobium wenxiniae]|nr:hypothetical protein GCM10010924_12110 [Rhizobium wenxiniae]
MYAVTTTKIPREKCDTTHARTFMKYRMERQNIININTRDKDSEIAIVHAVRKNKFFKRRLFLN